jgi:uracil-DNA glycosylase
MAKRQLGLAEAFMNAANGAVARPAKRARTASPPPPPATTTSTAPTSVETTDLRSDSFSASQWKASLATGTGGPKEGSSAPSEADLLALEATTLHPSWLEHLQDELRKPYFLDLKRFLWSEGLRGTQDRQGGKLKVFPPGACRRDQLCSYLTGCLTTLSFLRIVNRSARRVRLEPVHPFARCQGRDSRSGSVP